VTKKRHNAKYRHSMKLTRHHIIPRSRGGRTIEQNTTKLPRFFHDAWHDFFYNMLPEEAILFINIIFTRRKKLWTKEHLYDTQLGIQHSTISLMQVHVQNIKLIRSYIDRSPKEQYYPKPDFYEKARRAWRILFKDLSPGKAIEFIKIIMRVDVQGQGGKWCYQELRNLRKKLM
jgi:hypothetical protein